MVMRILSWFRATPLHTVFDASAYTRQHTEDQAQAELKGMGMTTPVDLALVPVL